MTISPIAHHDTHHVTTRHSNSGRPATTKNTSTHYISQWLTTAHHKIKQLKRVMNLTPTHKQLMTTHNISQYLTESKFHMILQLLKRISQHFKTIHNNPQCFKIIHNSKHLTMTHNISKQFTISHNNLQHIKPSHSIQQIITIFQNNSQHLKWYATSHKHL